ncbi:MAG: 23S rRNA (adenine(2503)-C(2))-methyltransferase RlmN [Deltaproteobacteria bacterium]|nr:23S rRNA (adenine(2503)-C(2))-methyltransferase RlmN [Deltaproteobacteria bacterium]
MSAPRDLRSLNLDELSRLMTKLEEPSYRAEQVFRWVHRSCVTSVDMMTNLPKELHQKLAYETTIDALEIDKHQRSKDGTQKLRLRCQDGALIESVLIPRDDKLTLCMSSQVGCALGCTFCATATIGIKRSLTVGEIVGQVYAAHQMLAESEVEGKAGNAPRVTNLVFMGMGEPMANLDRVVTAARILCHDQGQDFSPRRITVSTVGMIKGIERLGKLMPQLGLAVSLHATTDAVRDRLIPINQRWPLESLLKTLREFPLPRRRRITFEYMLLAGINDTTADAKRLPALLNKIPCKINLLAYNPSRDDQPDYQRPSDDVVEEFAERLRAKGLTVTVRQSRGLDIDAACGQLALQADPNAPKPKRHKK